MATFKPLNSGNQNTGGSPCIGHPKRDLFEIPQFARNNGAAVAFELINTNGSYGPIVLGRDAFAPSSTAVSA